MLVFYLFLFIQISLIFLLLSSRVIIRFPVHIVHIHFHLKLLCLFLFYVNDGFLFNLFIYFLCFINTRAAFILPLSQFGIFFYFLKFKFIQNPIFLIFLFSEIFLIFDIFLLLIMETIFNKLLKPPGFFCWQRFDVYCELFLRFCKVFTQYFSYSL